MPLDDQPCRTETPAPTSAVEVTTFETMMRAASAFVFVLDVDATTRWCNEAAQQVFGDAPGRPFAALLNEGSRKAFCQACETAVTSALDVELHHHLAGGMLVVSYRLVPLGDGRIGAMGIDRSREMEIVTQMSVLIEELDLEVRERKRLAARLEELAITDGLTGLYNRRQFDDVLAREWARWRRYGCDFSLLLLDIDHFKKINDEHGHQLGDEVLRVLASDLRGALRREDCLARYGGEEFAVLALGTGALAATELAQRLLVAVRRMATPDPLEGITVSIGVAMTDPSMGSEEDLIRAADDALYRAKREGRNRVVVHSAPVASAAGTSSANGLER